MQRTYYPKPEELHHEWFVVDASGQNLGRLASRIANVLVGKGKPSYTPGVDTGDFVIVVNAEKVAFTPKRMDQKVYYRISGYPGGIRRIGLREQLDRHPDRVIRSAVKGMLPRNRQSRQLINKLKIYAGPDHPHAAQKPKPLS